MKHCIASHCEWLTEIERYFKKMAHSSQSEPQLGIPDQKMMSYLSVLILIPSKTYSHILCNNLLLKDHKSILRIFWSIYNIFFIQNHVLFHWHLHIYCEWKSIISFFNESITFFFSLNFVASLNCITLWKFKYIAWLLVLLIFSLIKFIHYPKLWGICQKYLTV